MRTSRARHTWRALRRVQWHPVSSELPSREETSQMIGNNQQKEARDRRAGAANGQALIEMAIVIVILVTITVASIDFGVYMYRYVQASNCVREAARRAVVRKYADAMNPPYCIDAQLPAPSWDPAPPSDALAPGDPIRAYVDVNYDWLALDTFIPGITGKIKVGATMRMEGRKV
jgi:hypothetical protein